MLNKPFFKITFPKPSFNRGWSILIVVVFHVHSLMAQVGLGDCTGAIEICGNGKISSNAIGAGNEMEVGPNNSCSSFEHNSLWIKIEITKSGTLGFLLKPTSTAIDIDYDFFVYGPNVGCGNIGNSIRCSTTNPLASGQANNLTGMNDLETDVNEGPGPNGNSFVKSLDVSPGETYYIVIDRPIGESPFELEWTGTATLEGSPFPEGIEVNEPDDLIECGVDGSAEFDIFQTRADVTDEPNAVIKYYSSIGDATDKTNELDRFFTSSTSRKTIYVRIENPLTGCYDLVDFEVIVAAAPPVLESMDYELCDLDFDGAETFILESKTNAILNGLAAKDVSVSFHESIDDAKSGKAPLPGEYSSRGEIIYARVEETGEHGCFGISEINLKIVIPSQLSGAGLERPDFTMGSERFEVHLPNGPYDYALNDPRGPYQQSPIFRNVPAGINILYIRAADQCALSSVEVVVPAYNLFITPNNDGQNDHWRVDLGNYQGPVDPIRIFDRYGNFLAEVVPNSRGWDGTFSGKELPSDDYWFILNLPERFQIKGHFSIVR